MARELHEYGEGKEKKFEQENAEDAKGEDKEEEMKKIVIAVGVVGLVACVCFVGWRFLEPAILDMGVPTPPKVVMPKLARAEQEARKHKARTPAAVGQTAAPATNPTQRPSVDHGAEMLPAASQEVGVVISEGGGRKYRERLAAVSRLGMNLDRRDVEAIYRWMEKNAGEQKDMTPMELNAVKNEVLTRLIEQEKLPEDLGEKMVAMLRNERCDDIWRDYCVQHLSAYYARRWPKEEGKEEEKSFTEGNEGNKGEAKERQMMIDACWEAVGHAQGTIGGSALLCLERLSEEYPEFKKEEVAKKALEVATDARTGTPTKITAIQVAGRMGNTNALAVAKDLAVSGENVVLRASSIATIGYVGQKEDIEFLKGLEKDKDEYVRKAATAALARLEKRM